MIVDWTGSDPQVRGPINATYGVTSGAVYNAVFHVTDSNIPKNSGAYRPIHIIAPPGSVVNVVYPGPSVGGNTETHPKLVDMVTGALAPVMREKVAAAEGAQRLQLPVRRLPPEDGRLLRQLPPRGLRLGRQGLRRRQQLHDRRQRQLPQHAGRDLRDALSARDGRVHAARRTPAARARHRGGLGTRRIMRIGPGAEVTANALFDRTKGEFRAWGLEGGGPGGYGAILVKRAGDTEFRTFPEVFGTVSASKFTNIVPQGGRRGAARRARRRRLRRPRTSATARRSRRDVAEGFVSRARPRASSTAGRETERWAAGSRSSRRSGTP